MIRGLILGLSIAMASPRAAAIVPPVTEQPTLDPVERDSWVERFRIGEDGRLDRAGVGSAMARLFERWMAADEHWQGVPSWMRARVAADISEMCGQLIESGRGLSVSSVDSECGSPLQNVALIEFEGFPGRGLIRPTEEGSATFELRVDEAFLRTAMPTPRGYGTTRVLWALAFESMREARVPDARALEAQVRDIRTIQPLLGLLEDQGATPELDFLLEFGLLWAGYRYMDVRDPWDPRTEEKRDLATPSRELILALSLLPESIASSILRGHDPATIKLKIRVACFPPESDPDLVDGLDAKYLREYALHHYRGGALAPRPFDLYDPTSLWSWLAEVLPADAFGDPPGPIPLRTALRKAGLDVMVDVVPDGLMLSPTSPNTPADAGERSTTMAPGDRAVAMFLSSPQLSNAWIRPHSVRVPATAIETQTATHAASNLDRAERDPFAPLAVVSLIASQAERRRVSGEEWRVLARTFDVLEQPTLTRACARAAWRCGLRNAPMADLLLASAMALEDRDDVEALLESIPRDLPAAREIESMRSARQWMGDRP